MTAALESALAAERHERAQPVRRDVDRGELWQAMQPRNRMQSACRGAELEQGVCASECIEPKARKAFGRRIMVEVAFFQTKPSIGSLCSPPVTGLKRCGGARLLAGFIGNCSNKSHESSLVQPEFRSVDAVR